MVWLKSDAGAEKVETQWSSHWSARGVQESLREHCGDARLKHPWERVPFLLLELSLLVKLLHWLFTCLDAFSESWSLDPSSPIHRPVAAPGLFILQSVFCLLPKQRQESRLHLQHPGPTTADAPVQSETCRTSLLRWACRSLLRWMGAWLLGAPWIAMPIGSSNSTKCRSTEAGAE